MHLLIELIVLFILQTRCNRQWKCLKCNSLTKFSGLNRNKQETIAKNKCDSKHRFCKACHKLHDPTEDCVLKIDKFSDVHPKLCVISFAISDQENMTCYPCSQLSEKCIIHQDLHEKSPREPYCNFIVCLREVCRLQKQLAV